ncbi:hypothetical protein TeGR_g6760 [Tetraparma gracilis]|uniref:Glycine transporter domain-containing protein n=1 Tax=Tetraparma gracilis TaxID=2962635 RepID=A0ABQ6NAP6_9STRA|nr:hypothetical protein TeGR_g6760 [Tetraparma gracilis]
MVSLDFFGTAVFAVSGSLVALERGMSVLGALALALATAVGGGTLRDLLIEPAAPAFWLADPRYLRTVLLACPGALLLFPRLERRRRERRRAVPNRPTEPRLGSVTGSHPALSLAALLSLFDALSLGAFASLGASKASRLSLPPSAAVLSGVLSACGGGVVRDALAGVPPRALHATRSVYAGAAAAGAAAYVAGAGWGEERALWGGVAVAVAVRMGASLGGVRELEAGALAGKKGPPL